MTRNNTGADENKININVLDHGTMPTRMSTQASGYDLFAAIPYPIAIPAQGIEVIPCGFQMELLPGFEAQIRSRSGLSAKHGVFCLNGVGTIDADYRGEVGAVMANFKHNPFVVEPGMRIAQMVICRLPDVQLEQVFTLSETDRGTQGYGSTGT